MTLDGVFHSGASFSKAQRLFVHGGHVNILFSLYIHFYSYAFCYLAYLSKAKKEKKRRERTYSNIESACKPRGVVVMSLCDVGHTEDILEVDKTLFILFFSFSSPSFVCILYLLPFFLLKSLPCFLACIITDRSTAPHSVRDVKRVSTASICPSELHMTGA